MKPGEIFFLTLLFVAGFYMAEFLVDHLLLENSFQRFVARVGFQLQLYGLIYLMFDSRDTSRRIRELEKRCADGAPEEDKKKTAEMEGN